MHKMYVYVHVHIHKIRSNVDSHEYHPTVRKWGDIVMTQNVSLSNQIHKNET